MIEIALIFLKRFWPYILAAVAFVAISFAVWRWDAGRLERAREEGREELRPQIRACIADRDTAVQANKEAEAAIKALRAAYGDLEAAVKALEKRELEARLRSDRILAELVKKEREHLEEAARLQAIISGPRASTREEACDGADTILTEAARERRGRITQ